MGQEHPSREYGDLFFRTDKPFYYAGDTVTGTVFIDLHKSFPGSLIYLHIKGEEKSWWKERIQRGEEVHYEEHHGHFSFYDNKFVVYDWHSDYLPHGQYEIPISFLLKENLPGSFSEHEDGKWTADIHYHLEAELHSHDHHVQSLNYRQQVCVRELLEKSIEPVHAEQTSNIKTWCCMDKGTSKLVCFFEKNSYAPGDEANIIAEVDNEHCQIDVEYMEAKLVKRVELKDDHHGRHVVTEHVTERRFPGVGHGQKKVGSDHIITPITLIDTNDHEPVQPSTCGRIVKCTYSLNVTSKMAGVICCTLIPSICCNIQIYAPEIKIYQVPERDNWAPQRMDLIPVNFGQMNANVKMNVDVNLNPMLNVLQEQQHMVKDIIEGENNGVVKVQLGSDYASFNE